VSVSQPHSGQAIRSGSETFLRILFGVFMAVIAVALTFLPDPIWFAAVTCLAMMLAAREWHRMVRDPAQREAADRRPIHVQTGITGLAILLSAAALLYNQVILSVALLLLGAAAAFVLAKMRDDNPLWHAGGVLYVGVPALALVSMKVLLPQGQLVLMALFLIVWSTDTGALLFGRLIGGAKLAPTLSPGKTWAGTIGGSVTAALVFGLYIAILDFAVIPAMTFALAFSVVSHLGDLFESLVKRRFGYKDSGGLIPGHGGVLDRVDSLLACSIVMALLVFGLHFNPLFGGRT
jgi:phosphatidate cytidylyltransferase